VQYIVISWTGINFHSFHGGIFAGFFDNSILPRMTNKVLKFLLICVAITGKNRPRFLI
jgi:hypothetical protein